MNNIITCPYCRTIGQINEYDPCSNGKGVWCPVCESFIWYDTRDNHQRLSLLLEQKNSSASTKEIDAITLLKLNKHLSPIRYPGGKSKLIDYLFSKLQVNKCKTFVEVFAGGCSFGLALLEAGIIENLVINDKDKTLITFWNEAINHPETLIERLKSINPTHIDYAYAKQVLSSIDEISSSELAWSYLLANRLSYSGIIKGGCMGGKNGSNEALCVRYNPNRLIKQIKRIYEMKDHITVLNQDYVDCIETYYWDDKATLFIDPPYYEKGKQLYTNYFTAQDHCTLSELITNLTLEFPDAADVLITYDNAEFIKNLYWTIKPEYVQRQYSI